MLMKFGCLVPEDGDRDDCGFFWRLMSEEDVDDARSAPDVF